MENPEETTSPQLPPASMAQAKPKAKKKRRKKKLKKPGAPQSQPSQPANQRPLPPPLPFESQAGSAPSFASSLNSTEPKPGEPLPPEAERALHAVPDVIGAGDTEDAERDAIGFEPDEIRNLIPEIEFDQAEVEAVLEEACAWVAEKRHHEHWKLTERQSRMIGRPTTQLLTSLWSKIGTFLPDFLARWCESTPGLAGAILMGGIVFGPKIAYEIHLSREERAQQPRVRATGSSAQPRPGPAPVPPRGGPVGVASTGPVVPLDENGDAGSAPWLSDAIVE